MTVKAKSTVAASQQPHGYEFGGPIGTFILSSILPFVVYILAFFINDVTGAPPPSVLSPSTFTLDKLKQEVGWKGIGGLINLEAVVATLGWYTLQLLLHRFLPATVIEGVQLENGGKQKYRLNAFNCTLATLAILAVGTLLYGANWVVWTFIYDQYIPLLTTNILVAYFLATFVYVRSFGVKPRNKESRELALGGNSGNMVYDWWMGRELNPKITLPIIGELDIKEWCEVAPGMLLWLVLDLAFMAAQYRHYGQVTASMLIVTYSQAWYILDAKYLEPAVLTTIDIISDGFGLMLSFGDLVWVPFVFSLQTRYLAIHPVSLTFLQSVGIIAVQMFGYYIFRSSNNQKNVFRNNPNDPKVAHLTYLETKSGSRLITSGWWGTARHINYLGDWVMSWAYCLPTLLAGYEVLVSPTLSEAERLSASFFGGRPITAKVIPADPQGWAIPLTYFYLIYFGILLVHRERRDEEKCRRKYGKDWDEYCKRVPSRIIPGIY